MFPKIILHHRRQQSHSRWSGKRDEEWQLDGLLKDILDLESQIVVQWILSRSYKEQYFPWKHGQLSLSIGFVKIKTPLALKPTWLGKLLTHVRIFTPSAKSEKGVTDKKKLQTVGQCAHYVYMYVCRYGSPSFAPLHSKYLLDRMQRFVLKSLRA